MHLSEPEIEKHNLTTVARLAANHLRVLVNGPTGSGRTSLLRQLANHEGVVAVEPPPLSDPDAVLHALAQMAVGLGPEPLGLAQDAERSISERTELVLDANAARDRVVAFRMPATWTPGRSRGASPGHQLLAERAEELLRSFAGHARVRRVLLVGDPGALPFEVQTWEQLALARMFLGSGALQHLEGFGSYAEHADRVATRCGDAITPLQFRLAVGLEALGAFSDAEADMLARARSSVRVLQTRLMRALVARPQLAAAAYRLAMARRPVPVARLTELTEVPDDHAPLLEHCLAYGSPGVRMHEVVRSGVVNLRGDPRLRGPLFHTEEDSHGRYARHHGALDGTSSMLDSRSPLDWLERVHHLAHAGPEAEDEWASLELASREQYWDRGRALSRHGHHAAAAKVYRACLERFGERDAYAQHYLGFNVDRGAGPFEAAREAYAKAVALDAANPWWNGRLVTFLIRNSQFLDARRAWDEALTNVDPNDVVVHSDDGWLAKHLHRWVVTAWLEVGQVELAREAFDAIPLDLVAAHELLRDLEHRLLDAEEARDLGESVYPASIPPSERWMGPRHLPDERDGHSLLAWYPGRVIEEGASGVLVVFAVPHADEAQRRVMSRTLSLKEWSAASGSRAAGFIEIGSYAGGELVILPVENPEIRWQSELNDADLMAPLGRWDRRAG